MGNSIAAASEMMRTFCVMVLLISCCSFTYGMEIISVPQLDADDYPGGTDFSLAVSMYSEEAPAGDDSVYTQLQFGWATGLIPRFELNASIVDDADEYSMLDINLFEALGVSRFQNADSGFNRFYYRNTYSWEWFYSLEAFSGDTDRKYSFDISKVFDFSTKRNRYPIAFFVGEIFRWYNGYQGALLIAGGLYFRKPWTFNLGLAKDNSTWFNKDEFEYKYRMTLSVKVDF